MRADKRVFDIVCAGVGAVTLAPLLLVLALLVKLQDGGPVFFRQERVGHRGRLFRVWKFRSMVPDAASRGPQLTVASDCRITRVGRWLRQLKLDELPQLFNVLSGEMSLVGPRPEIPQYVSRYSPEQRRVLEIVPGITDEASIRFRNEHEILEGATDPERMYVETIMPRKVQMSLEYARRAYAWTDLVIVLRTLRHIFDTGRRSAHPDPTSTGLDSATDKDPSAEVARLL